MPALEATALTRDYRGAAGPVRALDAVDLSIPERTLFCFLGRNGAGKTTFIKIAATLLMPTSGSVRLFGEDVVDHADRVRERIAVVPQEGRTFYHLTPREHVREYLRVRGFSSETTTSRTDDILAAMALTPFSDTASYALSGGQQQRTLVAMVLATKAPFLFLDEPTLGMDPFARRQVWEVIRRAVRDGSTVLLTTHYLDEADHLADTLAVIEGGRILYRGTAAALKASLHREVRLEFGPGMPESELTSFGRLTSELGRRILLTTKPGAAELTEKARVRGIEVAVGPVTLEDAFLELVGRSIDEDPAP